MIMWGSSFAASLLRRARGCRFAAVGQTASGNFGQYHRSTRILKKIFLIILSGRFDFGKMSGGPRCARQARQRLAYGGGIIFVGDISSFDRRAMVGCKPTAKLLADTRSLQYCTASKSNHQTRLHLHVLTHAAARGCFAA